MLIIIEKKVILMGLLVLLLGIIIISNFNLVTEVFNTKYLSVVVIDPGHGGIDGGAVSSNGVKESDINLEISFKLKKIFEENGWKVIMTRQKDIGLYANSGSIRSKKIQDLINRKKIIDKANPDYVFIVHLNSFPQSSCYGAQTFYPSHSKESKLVATHVQKALVEGINNGNHRKEKPKNDILLLKNVKVPTVLVECGFLSNSNEAQMLQNDEYQNKLVQCIYKGLLDYCVETNNIPQKNIDYIVNK